MAAERRRRRQGAHERGDVRRRRREAPLDPRAEVLDVGHRDDRRLRLPVEVAAPRQQRVVDHVDDDAVLHLVLRALDERGGEGGVAVGVARPRRRAGQRMRRDRAPVDGDEQLRRGAEEAVDGEAVAQPERRLEPVEDAVAVERARRRDGDLAGDHRLGEPSGAHRVACGGDGGEVGRRRESPARSGSCRRRAAVGRMAVPAARRIAIAASMRVTQQSPLGRLDDGDAWDDDLAGLAGHERDPPDAHGRRHRAASCRRGRSPPARPAPRRAGRGRRRRDRRGRRRRGRTGSRRRGRCR